METPARIAIALLLLLAASPAGAQPVDGPAHLIMVDGNGQELGGFLTETPQADTSIVVRDVPGVPLIGMQIQTQIIEFLPGNFEHANLFYALPGCTGQAYLSAHGPNASAPPKYKLPRTWFPLLDTAARSVHVADDTATPGLVAPASAFTMYGDCFGWGGQELVVPAIDTGHTLPSFVPPFRLTTRARNAPGVAGLPVWGVPALLGLMVGLALRRGDRRKATA
jgi:hypothetical protein